MSEHINRVLDQAADERSLPRWCRHESVLMSSGKIIADVWIASKTGDPLTPPEPDEWRLDQMATHHFHIVRPDGYRQRAFGFQEACLQMKLAQMNDERTDDREARWFR